MQIQDVYSYLRMPVDDRPNIDTLRLSTELCFLKSYSVSYDGNRELPNCRLESTYLTKMYPPTSPDGSYILVYGDQSEGGAYNNYKLFRVNSSGDVYNTGGVCFQDGPPEIIDGVEHWNGVTMEDLLRLCAVRLEQFQAGKYPSPENAAALDHINKAIKQLEFRMKRVAEED